MKSAVFYGKHDLRVEESAKPAVGRRDVLINVKACGVCGTDVHIYEGDKGAADVTPPTILGHEFAGVVEAVMSRPIMPPPITTTVLPGLMLHISMPCRQQATGSVIAPCSKLV